MQCQENMVLLRDAALVTWKV